MHHAQLHSRVRINRLNGFWQAAQPIFASNEDVLDASVLQLGQDRELELGAFRLRQPHTQQFLLSIQVDC